MTLSKQEVFHFPLEKQVLGNDTLQPMTVTEKQAGASFFENSFRMTVP